MDLGVRLSVNISGGDQQWHGRLAIGFEHHEVGAHGQWPSIQIGSIPGDGYVVGQVHDTSPAVKDGEGGVVQPVAWGQAQIRSCVSDAIHVVERVVVGREACGQFRHGRWLGHHDDLFEHRNVSTVVVHGDGPRQQTIGTRAVTSFKFIHGGRHQPHVNCPSTIRAN